PAAPPPPGAEFHAPAATLARPRHRRSRARPPRLGDAARALSRRKNRSSANRSPAGTARDRETRGAGHAARAPGRGSENRGGGAAPAGVAVEQHHRDDRRRYDR